MKHPSSGLLQGGDFEVVKCWVEAGADLNKANFFYLTPLIRACQKGDVKTARLLLEKGVDPYKADLFYCNSFWYGSSHPEVLSLLEEAKNTSSSIPKNRN